MNTSMSRRWLLSFFVLFATVGYAALVPVLDIAKLVERADIVVIGRIVHVADAGPASIDLANGQVQARSMLGEVLVDHVFKGRRPSGRCVFSSRCLMSRWGIAAWLRAHIVCYF